MHKFDIYGTETNEKVLRKAGIQLGVLQKKNDPRSTELETIINNAQNDCSCGMIFSRNISFLRENKEYFGIS